MFDALTSLLLSRHSHRMSYIETAAQRSAKRLWWPFTQHKSLEPGAINVSPSRPRYSKHTLPLICTHVTIVFVPVRDVQVVDSRCGEQWSVYSKHATNSSAVHQQEASLQPLYDACSSWWTQVRWQGASTS
jgi:dethiobiotin synthetase/adenosylmethionine--8-amino-7-oxononanoate aminotransferase